MTHISTPTPSHAIATERMDVRALWEVYASNPPVIRTRPMHGPPPWSSASRDAPTALVPRPFVFALRERARRTGHASIALAARVRARVAPTLRAWLVARVSPLTVLLFLLASWAGIFVTTRAVNRLSAPPANAAATPAPRAEPPAAAEAQPAPASTPAPTAPGWLAASAEAPVVMTIELSDPQPASTAARPPPRLAAPKRFHVANDADMAAAARANQASQQALDTSLK